MKRVLTFLVAGALALVPLVAVAAPDAKSTKTASGSVTAVTADSVTIKSGANELKFAVDKETKLTGKGGSRKMAAAKKEGKEGIVVTDMVAVGDRITVKYHDMGGGMLHAAQIRVTAKGTTD